MVERDFKPFCDLIDGAYELHQKTITSKAKALFFASLQQYSLEEVQRALSAHVVDPINGRFPPQPAHVISNIAGASGSAGRPGVEEAWAIAINAGDERETVIWTREMREAFAICRPVFDRGDEVGARMAFKDAYARLVAEANRNADPVVWEISAGWDADKREQALTKAVAQKRLQHCAILPVLPGPRDAGPIVNGLLPATSLMRETKPSEFPEADVAARIAEMRHVLAESTDRKEALRLSQQQAERDRTFEAKQKTQAAVDAALAT